MQHILYISYDGLTDPLGQSQVLPYLVELSKKGYIIHIVSCEKETAFNLQEQKIKNILVGLCIHWYPTKYSNTIPLLSAFRNLQRLKKKANQIVQKHSIIIVHCRSYIASLIGLELKKKHNIKFIFDMRGFWADERIEGNIWNIKNPIFKLAYNYFKKKEKEFLSEADYVISLTENGKHTIEKWADILYKKPLIDVIPCCVDTDLFSEIHIDNNRKQELKELYKLDKNTLVISYLGSIGSWYLLDEMLVFFKHLLLKRNNSVLLFITPDKPQAILDAATKFEIPTNRLIIQKASREQIPTFLSLSNLNLFFIKPSFSKKASSPTKLAEVLSMGIPVITNSGVGDVDAIINEHKCGIVLPKFTAKEFEIANSSIDDLLQKPSADIRKVAVDYFSLKIGAERYDSVYKKMLNTH